MLRANAMRKAKRLSVQGSCFRYEVVQVERKVDAYEVRVWVGEQTLYRPGVIPIARYVRGRLARKGAL